MRSARQSDSSQAPNFCRYDCLDVVPLRVAASQPSSQSAGSSDDGLAGIRSLVYVVQLSISGCIATCSMTGFAECFDFLI